ncbi:MAG: sugar transferase [Patescibacteria group bacterium]
MNNNLKKFILVAGDVVVLYLSLYLTLLIRYWAKPTSSLWSEHLGPFTIIFAVWLIIFYISKLYDLNLAVNNVRFFQLTARSLVITVLLSAAFFYLTPQVNIAPKRNLIIYVIIFAILFYFWRQFFNWSLKAYLPKNNLAFVGYNPRVNELINELKNNPHLGYNICFLIDGDESNNNLNNVPIYKNIKELNRLITRYKISTIVLTANPHQSDELKTTLFNCLSLKINYIYLPNFYESVTGKIPIETIGHLWFLENLSEGSKQLFNRFKRFYDFIFSIIIFLITLPLWPIIGLIIKLESRGPVFFLSKRIGQNNREFSLLKFRTMREENNNRVFTKANDSRITKFGSLLRKTRLDEIPQMINIALGDMSFVGPRPERPELIEELEKAIPFYRERMLVKPGVTGWDQVSGEYHSPSQEDTLKKLQYDLYYIKNRSIYLDLSIILKTIATVLSGGGR